MLDVRLNHPVQRSSEFNGNSDVYGRRCGFGSEVWRNKDQRFTGNFLKDAFHGEGTYKWSKEKKKVVFEGRLYSDYKEGYGLVSLSDGSVFEGLFRNNRAFGPGVRTYPNGRQDVAFWCGKKIVRLGRPVDFIIPRLASTSLGKLKLLQFQTVMPFLEDDTDIVSALMTKYNFDPSKSYRLYSYLIRDRRSIFFNRESLDRAYFVKMDDLDLCSHRSSATSLQNTPLFEGTCDTLYDVPVSDSCQAEDGMIGILRYHTENKTLLGYPLKFPGERSMNISAEIEMEGEQIEDESAAATYLVSWNRSEICMDILRQIFRFRSCEDDISFKVSDLMAGARSKFRKTGDTERKCIHFLRMCFFGPSYVVRDLLCSADLSEELMDSRGNNSIMFAAAADQHDIINLLLNHGADVNSFNDENLTPLNFCLLRRLAQTYDLGNWEESFLPPQNSSILDGKWQVNESIKSLDRIFGDGMSIDESRNADEEKLLTEETDSVFCFEEEGEASDETSFTLMRLKVVERQVDNSNAIPEDDIGKMIIPDSFKTEEYAASVAKPSGKEKYFFDLALDVCSGQEWKTTNEDILSLIVNIDKTIELLLLRGADPNIADAPKPSLHLAIYARELRLVELLLAHGASPDSQSLPQEGLLTPLHVIVLMKPSSEQLQMCELLLKYGANPEEETAPDFNINLCDDSFLDSDQGRTPLQLLCMRRDAECCDPEGFLSQLALFLVRVSKRRHFFKGHSYLTLAMMCGNCTIMETLLKSKKVNPNEILGEDLQTPLHVLLSTKCQKRTLYETSIRMCDMLLNGGGNPNLKLKNGTCVDYGYREIEEEKLRRLEEKETMIPNKKSERDYLEDHIKVVEYVAKRSSQNLQLDNKDNKSKIVQMLHENEDKLVTKQRIDEAGSKVSGNGENRSRRQTKGRDKDGESTRGNKELIKNVGMDTKDHEWVHTDVNSTSIKLLGQARRGELQKDGTEKIIGVRNLGRAEKGVKMKEIAQSITEIKKYTVEGKRQGKTKMVPSLRMMESTSHLKNTSSNEPGKTKLRACVSGLNEKRSSVMTCDRFPEKFRQSLIHMFGTCGRFNVNDLLLPYVVLRNGDLYYRFKGRKKEGMEQYSLI